MRRFLARLRAPVALAIVGYFGYVLGQGPAPAEQGSPPPTTVNSAEATPSASPGGPTGEVASQDADEPAAAQPDIVQTEDGAVAAALRFLELTEVAVAMSPADGAALQRSISTEASADRLAAEVEATLTDVELSVPEGLTVHVAPLGTSARAVGEGWEVSVWYVEVIVYGDELAVEQWRMATYTVEREAGEWRMADLVSRDGPTPVRPASIVASTTAELIATTAGLSDEGWGS